MFKKIEEKFMQEETSDVKIICGDKTLYCHRFILDCQSDFFKGNDSILIARISHHPCTVGMKGERIQNQNL